MVKLKSLAYARSGDKGDSANIGVIVSDPKDYAYVKEKLTSEVVHAFFAPLGVRKTTRYELPNLTAFNFVLEGVLEQGGSLSLRVDNQGKVLGQALLEIEI